MVLLALKPLSLSLAQVRASLLLDHEKARATAESAQPKPALNILPSADSPVDL